MEIQQQQQQTPQQTIGTASKASFEVSGVSRSGRVRKKSSKLLDFQSPDEVENKKVKRSAIKNTLVLNSSGVPRYSGRGRPSNAMKARRALLHAAEQQQQQQLQMDDGDDLDDLDMELRIGGKMTSAANGIHQLQTITADDGKAHNASALLNTSTASAETAPPDSDDELINLVADLVEGVEAEMVNEGNPNDTRVRQSLYMIEKSNKRKMLKDGKVITGKQERKDKGKSRYTAYSMWARELRKAGKLGKNQDMDFSNTARRLGELWANVSNKEKNAWRRKAKKLSSKERLREKTTGSSGGGNYGKKAHTMPLLNNNSAGSSNNNNATTANNNNANFLNRATTSRTRKLAAERIQQQQQQKQPVLTSKNSQNKSIHNNSSSRINSLRQSQSQSDISPPTTPTSAEGGEVRRKRTYTHRAKAGRITNGNATPSTSMTTNSKRLEVDKHNSAAKATTATSGVRTSTLKTKMPTRTVLTNNSGSPLKTRAKATQSPNNVTAACSTPTSTTSSSSATTAISQAVAPIDAAAHLKLLGESLTIIGERLKEHDGQIALSGSLSVLLDSLICSMGPLMCLTAFIPGLEQNEQLKSNLAETLDNIAYVMPGL